MRHSGVDVKETKSFHVATFISEASTTTAAKRKHTTTAAKRIVMFAP